MDASSTSGSGIGWVVLKLTYPSGLEVWQGIERGIERPDIARGWGEQFRFSGYWGLVGLEETGQYTVAVWVSTSCGWFSSTPRYFVVTEAPIPVHHNVDHPIEEATYSSSFNFSGWTVKQDGQPVAKVMLFFDLLPGQVGSYGEALCNEYRADLPEQYRYSGWHFFFNPAWVNAGWHRLYVFALDNDGRWLDAVARDFWVEAGE